MEWTPLWSRAVQGQLEETVKDQNLTKAAEGIIYWSRDDDTQIISDSQTRGGFNETINVNVNFVADPRSSETP